MHLKGGRSLNAKIDKLAARIDQLARTRGNAPKVATIQVPEWLDRDAVLERHWTLFPRDVSAENLVVVGVFGVPETLDRESTRSSCAWMQLAALEVASMPAHELRLRRGRQVLANLVRAAHVASRELDSHAYRVVADFGLTEEEALETVERSVEPGDRAVLREGFEFTRWRRQRSAVRTESQPDDMPLLS